MANDQNNGRNMRQLRLNKNGVSSASGADGNYNYHGGGEPSKPSKKKGGRLKNGLMKTLSIAATLVIIVTLIVNMPILVYSKTGEPTENISILTFVKRWQPLNIEGNLEVPKHDFKVNTEIVNDDFTDGLDLPQIVEGQYTVLFVGFDEDGYRTDVNWLFQFDIAAAKINVLQIPRDTFVPSYTSNITGKFNSVYENGNPEKSNIQRVVDTIQDNFGIPVDAYVTTHCYDIVDMVDLIGGIPITLDEQITYEADKIIPAGETVLNGQQAEWFVRYRHGFSEGDIGRVKNQRKFLAAAMEKMLNIYEVDGRLKFYSYLKEIYNNEYIHTDLSLENIGMIADLASTISLDNVEVNMVPGEGAWYDAPDGQRYSVWSVHKSTVIDMLNETYRPYQHDITPEESALYELVTNYLNVSNDDTSNTLQELQDGAKPGEENTTANAG